jgi:hypothetical protein
VAKLLVLKGLGEFDLRVPRQNLERKGLTGKLLVNKELDFWRCWVGSVLGIECCDFLQLNICRDYNIRDGALGGGRRRYQVAGEGVRNIFRGLDRVGGEAATGDIRGDG